MKHYERKEIDFNIGDPEDIKDLKARLHNAEFNVDHMRQAMVTYPEALEKAREAAKEHGYAIGIHGSMARDLDLMAMAWMEDHSSPEVLIKAICKAVDGRIDARNDGGTWPRPKAAGRLSWVIYFNREDYRTAHHYIDISIMPSTPK